VVAPAKAEPHLCAIVPDEEYRVVAGVRDTHPKRQQRLRSVWAWASITRVPEFPSNPTTSAAMRLRITRSFLKRPTITRTTGCLHPVRRQHPPLRTRLPPPRRDEEPQNKLSHNHCNP